MYAGCKDCVHYGPEESIHGFCDAPQLADHLDIGVGITYAGAVRDLKNLCGQAARWFKSKEKE